MNLMESWEDVRILSQIGCLFLFQEPGEVEIWKPCPQPNPVQRTHVNFNGSLDSFDSLHSP